MVHVISPPDADVALCGVGPRTGHRPVGPLLAGEADCVVCADLARQWGLDA